MIGVLFGTIEQYDDTCLVYTESGVGYAVTLAENTRVQLPTSQPVRLYIHTHVREDALELYGFLTHAEKQLFVLLLGISGIGPKTAVTLASYGAESVIEHVQQANVSFFTQVPRVGKKLAKKIILELSSKVGSLKELNLATPVGVKKDVVDALQQLGFSAEDAYAASETIPDDLPPSEAIKQALVVLRSKDV